MEEIGRGYRWDDPGSGQEVKYAPADRAAGASERGPAGTQGTGKGHPKAAGSERVCRQDSVAGTTYFNAKYQALLHADERECQYFGGAFLRLLHGRQKREQ